MLPRLGLLLALLVTLVLTACVPPAPPQGGDATTAPGAALSGDLIIYSGRAEPLIQPVVDAFRARHPGVKVLLKAGSNSQLANALLEEKANPQADLFITTELFTIQALAQQGAFRAYRPAGADQLPTQFVAPDGLWTGLTQRARVIMYNTDRVTPDAAPKSLLDLTDPKWRGQIAAAGSTNGSLQAQVAAMRQLLGEPATEAWLRGLTANKVTFFGGHTDVRKAVGSGEFALGLVNHYYFYLQQAEGSKVGIVFPDQGDGQMGLLTNATAVAVVKREANLPAAQAFVDFLVSAEGQRLFAEGNYEYPLLPGVALRAGVQPLTGLRQAQVHMAEATRAFDATFALLEKVGLP